MTIKFKFNKYSRRFKQPLKTHHGLWEVREGIIIELMDEKGKVGWGEIAPLSWFGSETLREAMDFCESLPGIITENLIFSIPMSLPACQFGLESALTQLQGNDEEIPKLENSGLLPTGKAGLSAWKDLVNRGYTTLKWKIGVDSIDNELNWLEILASQMSEIQGLSLRLDANGGLNFAESDRLLDICDRISLGDTSFKIEFLEQPLGVNELEGMLALTKGHLTSIALDESVATLTQINQCYQQGWRGIFVIKPAIVGSPKQLRKLYHTLGIDGVFSSVFETEIGQKASLQLAAELCQSHRAVGFGINHWFVDTD
ncbi:MULTISPECIES: o-succinylbenzoate synthase [Arthrospira]|uniref:o-succinylbenzoate synthase n=1 Tax=Limnospira TaxID=2596745 RepID=UPI0001C382C0|nr:MULTISPECIES: o-succinylbenzoate synthase [Arthrospira]AMW29754.1 o-succinylbenzoate synthase [Arthrospira platensis YZ]KDR56690.1 O-succinylbenzoate synthase [Arthrospira platensis str. Paraca]MBD2668266.1 o-succinylbenzoate synthase [Arthrospira platensis FACHB-439]MBD2711708.1 o-succinylbenzoate synthase [Arthrospira platensis FACHB-835]MDF2212262.1 o-succinylbenzoate synthase [Arthrospira platensis NCB002]MDT9295936.1 o-succinylbenzoate synthase [Arthrospira platensis PCC 7345]MDT9311